MIVPKVMKAKILVILQALIIVAMVFSVSAAGIPEAVEDQIFRGIDRVAANALKLGAQNGVYDVIRSAFMGLEKGIKAATPADAAASDIAGWVNFVVAAVMLDDLQRRGVSQNNPKLPKVPLAQAQRDVKETRLLVEKERFGWDQALSARAYNRAYAIVQKLYKGGQF